VSLFSCKGCTARDAEIQRLVTLLRMALDRAEQQRNAHLGELVALTRDVAARLGPAVWRPESGPAAEAPPPPLDPVIELFLDARFVHGTPTWRQQHAEAVKLADEGIDAERVCDVLARGMPIAY
jgi:hypothetical protein